MGDIDGRVLDGVSATTLWTLRNRAEEALREDSAYDDPLAIDLYRAIDYDYDRFGALSQTHPLRALAADNEIKRFLDHHPDATVVALAEGLQTSYWRVNRPVQRWLSVDLPPVLDLRNRLLPAESSIVSLPTSALDTSWADEVEPDSPTIITAEGLFMYFEPAQVHQLIAFCARRFRGGVMFYDSIPHWFSNRTMKGMNLTKNYRTPPMPYAQTVDEAAALTTVPGVAEVSDVDLPHGRGLWSSDLLRRISSLPLIRNQRPSLTRLRFE